MRKTITNIFAVCLLLGMSLNAMAGGNGGGKHFVFNLVGTGVAEAAMVPDPDGGVMEANCFEVDLFDLKNQRQIGRAVDCLTVQEVIGDFDVIKLIGTTTFHLPQGSLTTQGFTTVSTVKQPTVSPLVGDITHITGAAGTGNAIIDGTKEFKGATGTSRLSGLVNLMDLNTIGEITFDCIFVVDLDDNDD